MTKDSASDITYKQKLEALRKEKDVLESSNLKLKREKFALADQLHLQERVMDANLSGWLVWNIAASELTVNFPWKKLSDQHIQDPNIGYQDLMNMLRPGGYFGIFRMGIRLLESPEKKLQRVFHIDFAERLGIPVLVSATTLPDENGKAKALAFALSVVHSTTEHNLGSVGNEPDKLPIQFLKVDYPSGEPLFLNKAAWLAVGRQLGEQEFQHVSELIGSDNWQLVQDKIESNKQWLELELSLGSGQDYLAFVQKNESILDLRLVDISTFKQVIRELQQVNVQLDNFVYHASHDLRAPLRTVLGLLNILRTEVSFEERERCVDLIDGSINRLDTLVVDLLSISRNKRSANPQVKINFMVEVNQAVSSFYHLGNTKNLEVRTIIRQPKAFVADLTRVRIVINNIISNAIKYRRYNVDSFIEIRINVDSEAAHIEIEDNGEGIPPERITHIFDMFYRASQSGEGSGLGLYIVKDVLQKLDGSIEVSSIFGKSSLFKVTIPNRN